MATLTVLIVYVGWPDLLAVASTATPAVIAAWVGITLATRLLLVATLTLPLAAMGHSIAPAQAFWLGWARTFCNQVVPLSGLAYFAAFLRRSGVAWGELAALGSPQLLIAASASGGIGLIALAAHGSGLNGGSAALAAIFGSMAAAALPAVWIDAWATFLPRTAQHKLQATADALRALRQQRTLLLAIVGAQVGAVLLRALRLYVLLHATTLDVDFSTALLLSCVGEAAVFLSLTPGGIGLREGTLAGGAALLGLDVQVGAAVAIMDRILITAMTTLFAPMAFWRLKAADERNVASSNLNSTRTA